MNRKITVIRHPRENLKKCSLRHLHDHPNFEFLAAVDADADRPILLLDSTWHLLPKIRRKVYGDFVPRSLPSNILTAYPRVSKMHQDPHGLATVEALYAALQMMGTPDREILNGYLFGEKFLSINGFE